MCLRECEEISEQEFKKWSKLLEEYLCGQCRSDGCDFDYLHGLVRLEQLSKGGKLSIATAVARENLLIGEEKYFSCEEPVGYETETDYVAQDILSRFHTTNGITLKVTGDGDCLFNAVSLLLFGNETKSIELRYKTVLLMVNEESHILSHKDRAGIKTVCPDYDVDVAECTRLHAFSSAWAVMALAKVIKRPIRSIYPAVNEGSDSALPEVPTGVKENIYFFIRNEGNQRSGKAGLKREYWDDCGAWEKSSSPAAYPLPADGKLINLTKRNGLFCIEKSGRKFEILETQPALQDLVVINRSYSKLKADKLYKRRISWVTDTPDDFQYLSEDLMIVEYVGKLPGRGYHGKVKTVANKQPYIRSKPALKERAR
ncbi:VRTN-like protein [Mya arenaria]|uniref:VRTN-like protein n=1 Tax=Mya arenaria TaxID=6604 RepID=A0ABY7GBA6_MYAAR|nr:VRTN-like protein [Mya arenaria]